MFNKDIPHIYLFGVPIHHLTMDQTLELIDSAIVSKKQIHHVVVNAAKLVNMKKDAALCQSVIESDIINADGQSVIWASRLLGKSLPERVAGIDLMTRLVLLAAAKKYRIFFFGAHQNIVESVVNKYSEEYGPEIIAGYRNGYYDKSEEETIARQITDSRADILFVAITSPQKEIFLNTYRELINVPFIMGVGGAFDVVSGRTKRAPAWMQKSGLEWLYRVLQEPRRMWKRYLVTNSRFIGMLFKEFWQKKRI